MTKKNIAISKVNFMSDNGVYIPYITKELIEETHVVSVFGGENTVLVDLSEFRGTSSVMVQHLLWRGVAIHEDGRIGVLEKDNKVYLLDGGTAHTDGFRVFRYTLPSASAMRSLSGIQFYNCDSDEDFFAKLSLASNGMSDYFVGRTMSYADAVKRIGRLAQLSTHTEGDETIQAIAIMAKPIGFGHADGQSILSANIFSNGEEMVGRAIQNRVAGAGKTLSLVVKQEIVDNYLGDFNKREFSKEQIADWLNGELDLKMSDYDYVVIGEGEVQMIADKNAIKCAFNF